MNVYTEILLYDIKLHKKYVCKSWMQLYRDKTHTYCGHAGSTTEIQPYIVNWGNYKVECKTVQR